jgi:DsbC/DsbD-like thiol-disulfide interchange protein
MSRRAALTLCLVLAASAVAAEEDHGIATAELLPGWRAADGVHVAAFQLRLAPGWKTYWRAPGEAGIPPAFDWSASRNVAAVEPRWPRPMQFSLNGLRTLGYAGGLVLPLRVRPADAAAPVRLAGTVDLGICREVCVPLTLHVAADLPPRGVPDPAIKAALAAGAETAAEAGVRGHRCRIEPTGAGLRITAEIEVASLGPAEMLVIEAADPALWVGAAQTRRHGDRLTGVAEIVPLDDAPALLDRAGIMLTLLSEARAVELSGCPAG